MEPPSLLDRLKEQSLRSAGYAYLLGDASLFASGMLAGRPKEAATGLIWTAGGLACARYGNPGAEAQLRALSRRLGDYLRRQGVAIPDTPDTRALARPGGVIDHIEQFLYRHPSQVLNATYAIGGLDLLRSGMQHEKKWDAASGALVVSGALAGLLIPEKKAGPAASPQGPLQKAWAWMQEKPLRVSGGLYALNNVTLTLSAIGEMKSNPAQKSYLFKFLTAASYLFGNTMLSLSSKEEGVDAEKARTVAASLAGAAARVIAAQPPPLRQALLEQVAGFLSAQPDMKLSGQAIAQLLEQELAAQAPAPAPPGWQARLSPGQSAPGPQLS